MNPQNCFTVSLILKGLWETIEEFCFIKCFSPKEQTKFNEYAHNTFAAFLMKVVEAVAYSDFAFSTYQNNRNNSVW